MLNLLLLLSYILSDWPSSAFFFFPMDVTMPFSTSLLLIHCWPFWWFFSSLVLRNCYLCALMGMCMCVHVMSLCMWVHTQSCMYMYLSCFEFIKCLVSVGFNFYSFWTTFGYFFKYFWPLFFSNNFLPLPSVGMHLYLY